MTRIYEFAARPSRFKTHPPPPDTIREYLAYDPESGEFRWIKRGSKAGRVKSDGYMYVRFQGRMYSLHRLAWWFATGALPPMYVDHIDRDPKNNRVANLRPANASQNSANAVRSVRRNAGMKKGVTLTASGRFRAKIMVQRKSISLGIYDTEAEAHGAYVAAALIAFGEFARAAA